MLTLPEGSSFRFRFTMTDNLGGATDLTGYSTAQVKLRKPDLTVVAINAVIDSAIDGSGHVDVPAATLTGQGHWVAWAVVTWADGRVVKSHGVGFTVVAEGTEV